MVSSLATLELQTGANPDATVIWLHGLGADGHDFEPVVPQLGLPDDLHVRFVFPHAPSMPVSINGGYIMPAWYDIRHTDLGYEQDEQGMINSARSIQLLIDREEMHGIRADRIVLAGFSQGCAMALHVGLQQSSPLAGIIGLSGYLPGLTKLSEISLDQATSVFMAHGVFDQVVPYEMGEKAYRQLQQAGYPVEWHSYPMEHSVCMEEIKAIGQFLTKVLK